MTPRKICFVLAAIVAVLVVVLVPHAPELVMAFLWPHDVGGPALAFAILIPIQGKTPDQLYAQATSNGSVLQATREPYYDTQPVATAAAAATYTFFGATNADKSLSNARGQGGTFPNNTFFEPISLFVDILTPMTSGLNTTLGALDDIQKLVMSARSFITITLGTTTLPQIPIRMCHSSGGAVGTLAGTWTAPVQGQVGTNGVQDGGYPVWGSYTFTPNTAVSVVLTVPIAVTLATSPLNVCIGWDGIWHTQVSNG